MFSHFGMVLSSSPRRGHETCYKNTKKRLDGRQQASTDTKQYAHRSASTQGNGDTSLANNSLLFTKLIVMTPYQIPDAWYVVSVLIFFVLPFCSVFFCSPNHHQVSYKPLHNSPRSCPAGSGDRRGGYGPTESPR